MKLVIFSCSLNQSSRRQILAKHTYDELKNLGEDITWCDLSEYNLPLCDGGPSYGHKDVKTLNEISSSASGIILSTPIYNYSYNSTAKSLIEHVGRS